ncbi:Uncharacterized membrane protein [Peptoclostridium litorale DSM 5388]|uniref:Putative transmembrane protein n=1 Tax=Peptoclostridium litorale DSM 5388 TaxID=1121324 RepID=A0A069R9T5_PEPLI|nr:exopolysaccharide Pel transporter PelG [Peptoclostridium litorale]KDR93801.1 putative transmembrane protein [Peptoclostridium litorale DSM 5388]SIN86111.1 Uncharacterized membrane protein [Peptoclostridium litorale DSM 5388]
MAGIGFTLKKLFEDESYSARSKAYAYSALVSAGPWIAAVVTVNIIILLSKFFLVEIAQRDLFMGTMVYSFVFSQIITAPWQLLITRYVSDRLYNREYAHIRPSLIGLSKIVFAISYIVSALYYYPKDISLEYKIMAVYLFVFISIVWILMVYLSAVKNYAIISWAYGAGGIVSIGISAILFKHPIEFARNAGASNLLLAYTLGITVTFALLLYSFLKNFESDSALEYDFIRYMDSFAALFFTGLFYTLGLWADDIIMWYSSLGVSIEEVYRYAPLYDNGVFLAYLTVIPTMILFMVSVETEFYDTYRKYFAFATKDASYDDIQSAKNEMKTCIYRNLIYIMENQTIISITCIVVAGFVFSRLGLPIIVKDIFRICTLGALCNIFILIIILILLYFEARNHALAIALSFFALNSLFTLYFLPLGVEFYGFGYFAGSFVSLCIAIVTMIIFLEELDYHTFAKQPLFESKSRGFFTRMAERLEPGRNRAPAKRRGIDA